MGDRRGAWLLVVFLLAAAPTVAVDFYIDPVNGDDANDGTDPANPTRTVRQAIQVAESAVFGWSCAPTFHLAAGTYEEGNGEVFSWSYDCRRDGSRTATYVGAGRDLVTVIAPAGRTIFWLGSAANASWPQTLTVRGMTLRGDSTATALTMGTSNSFGDQLLVSDCRFEGFGVVAVLSTSTADSASGAIDFDRCEFHGGSFELRCSTQGVSNPSMNFANCLFLDNQFHPLGASFGHSTISLTNCTAVGSSPLLPYAWQTSTEPHRLVLTNNVFALGATTVDAVGVPLQSSLRNNVFRPFAGRYYVDQRFWASTEAELNALPSSSGNRTVEPLFVDEASGDYHLAANSPCIDAGTAVLGPNGQPLDVDFDGDPRPTDGDGDGVAAYDVGYDETAARLRVAAVLRDALTSLSPPTPALATLFPLASYLPNLASGSLEPDTSALNDTTRPLILYQVDSGTLKLVKTADPGIRLSF